MRNFCVIWVLLGVAFFCQGFSVALRPGRRPSRLHWDDLKERVLALEIKTKHNEERYGQVSLQMKEDNRELSKKMDNLSEKLEAKLDKRFAKMDAEMDKRFAEMDKRFEKVDKAFAETKAELKALSDGVTMKFIPLYLLLVAIAITTGMANAKNFVDFFK